MVLHGPPTTEARDIGCTCLLDGLAGDRGRIDVLSGLGALYFREDIQLHSAPLTRLCTIFLLTLLTLFRIVAGSSRSKKGLLVGDVDRWDTDISDPAKASTAVFCRQAAPALDQRFVTKRSIIAFV